MVLLALALAATQPGRAQVFTYKTGDLCLGIRKTGANVDADNNEVVVDIGQASNYVSLAIGSTIPVPNLSVGQLSGCFVDFNNIQWSVTGYLTTSNFFPGYPAQTLWLSEARPSASVQSTAWTREGISSQQPVNPKIHGIFGGAQQISKYLGVSSEFNTPYFVQENLTNSSAFLLDGYMDYVNMGITISGQLDDTWDQGSVEATNSASFTSGSEYLDLYEVRPLTDGNGNPIVDPHTGTNGPAYYLGYFQFTSGGSISFTRAANSSTPPPPPAPVLSFTLSGTTASISFASTNGATYTLYYTNSAGLTQPVSKWPSSPTTITGDGTKKAFVVPLTSANSFYRVSAH